MRIPSTIRIAGAGGLLALSIAVATSTPALAVPETEANNTFLTRDILASGITSYEAALDVFSFIPMASDIKFSKTFDEDVVFFGSTFGNSNVDSSGFLNGHTPGTPFVVVTDNPDRADLFLGIFDNNSNLLRTDDDGSPLGNGRASASGGIVNPDGSINFAVTGYDDDTFMGLHGECCDIDAYVRVGTTGADVDFVTFTGLTPGEIFSAETMGAGAPDTVLGLFSNAGIVVAADDDSGVGTRSKIGGIVPTGGTLNFAITGFDDFEFIGVHDDSGNYSLEISTFILGGPGAPPLDDIVEFPNNPATDDFFNFDLTVADGEVINLDPHIAIGYDYITDGLFQTVLLPMVGSDSEFELWLFNSGLGEFEFSQMLMAGDLFNFGVGVDKFSIRGIDPALGLDPNDTTAFVTQVSFATGGSFNVTMTPLTEPDAVPEPSTLIIFGLGLAGLGFMRRRKKLN